MRFSTFTLAFAVCLGAASAFAQVAPDKRQSQLDRELASLLGRPGGLTSETVARRASTTSPNVRAKRARIAAAASEQDRARVGWLPRVTLTARYTRLSPIDQPSLGPEGASLVVSQREGVLDPAVDPLIGVPASTLSFPVILNQYLLQANLTVPVSDYVLRTSQAQAAAGHSRRAAELSERASRSTVAANAKLAYYAWARARLQVVVAKSSLTQSRARLDAVSALLDAGRASRADVLAAESQLAGAELMVERAESLEAISEDRLRTAMHDPPNARYEIGENLLAPISAPASTNVRELVRRAERQRLELAALDASDRSVREQKKVARAANYPRLDLFGNAYYANPNPRVIPQEERWSATWDAGVQLTWTPNDVALASASANALEAQRAEIEAQKAELRDALRTEVFEAQQALREAQVADKTSERRLIAAEEAYRTRAELFDAGRATFVELTDAEAELLRARLERIDGKIALRTAKIRLDHAVGDDLGRR